MMRWCNDIIKPSSDKPKNLNVIIYHIFLGIIEWNGWRLRIRNNKENFFIRIGKYTYIRKIKIWWLPCRVIKFR